MTLIVVDTSVLVDHLRGHGPATRCIREAVAADHELCASVLTKVELVWGMRAPEKRSVRTLVDALTLLPVSETVADVAGNLAREYRSSYANIDLVDYVIGATAITHGATLWTRNVKRFPMVDGLTAPYE